MSRSLDALVSIGFRRAGCWSETGGVLSCNLEVMAEVTRVLYAFVSCDEVLYIGRSMTALKRRMYGYESPKAGQPTNLRNNAGIVALLRAGSSVEILALIDDARLQYARFDLSLAAGLEDSLIRHFRPPWNGAKSKQAPSLQMEAAQVPAGIVKLSAPTTPTSHSGWPEKFKAELEDALGTAECAGLAYLELTSGELHRRVGGYPGPKHNMVSCCNVMRRHIGPSDQVLQEPPQGNGASLRIRYALPRSRGFV